MQRSSTTAGQEHEIAWIVAPLNRNGPYSSRHSVMQNFQHAMRRGLDAQAERAGNAFSNRCVGLVTMQAQFTP